MIARIKVHNYLNGLLFSLVEYLLVVVILAPFLIFYVANGRALYSFIAAGVVLELPHSQLFCG